MEEVKETNEFVIYDVEGFDKLLEEHQSDGWHFESSKVVPGEDDSIAYKIILSR